MMMDWVWDIATSNFVLGIIAAILVAAFLVAHAPSLVLKLWPTAYLYSKAAALVQVLAAALLCFLIGFRASDERAEAKSLRTQIAAQQTDLRAANDAANRADAARAELAKKAKADEERIEDYEERLRRRTPNTACILVPDDFPVRVPNNRRSTH
jgi:hypothetical protein